MSSHFGSSGSPVFPLYFLFPTASLVNVSAILSQALRTLSLPILTPPVPSLLTNSLCQGLPQASGPNYSLLPHTCEMPIHFLPWRWVANVYRAIICQSKLNPITKCCRSSVSPRTTIENWQPKCICIDFSHLFLSPDWYCVCPVKFPQEKQTRSSTSAGKLKSLLDDILDNSFETILNQGIILGDSS